jgi:hypothetical protein
MTEGKYRTEAHRIVNVAAAHLLLVAGLIVLS